MDKVEFADPLLFLNLIGMHPFKTDTFSKTRQIISISVFFLVIFSGLLELIFNSQGLETFARASDTMVPQCQLVGKIAVVVVYKKEIARLLQDSEKFWPLDRFGDQHGETFGRTHTLLRRFFRVYKVMITFTCLEFIAVKVIFKIKKPVAICYGESKGLEVPYEQLYFLLHMGITWVSINIINGFDGLFFYFIGHVLSELHMVKTAFGNYDIGTNWSDTERFKITAKHHSFVLDFVCKFNKICSSVLLTQHVTCLFGICFGLFLMDKDGIPPEVDRATKYMPYIISFALQTLTFCFAGNLLITWSLEIPNEIYFNDWSRDASYRNKSDKIISMCRGQRPARLTLGGFGDLDLESFKMVMKNAFSFFAFMNTMIGQHNQE